MLKTEFNRQTSVRKLLSRWLGKYRLRTVLIFPFIIQISAAVGLTGWLSVRNGQQAVNSAIAQLSVSVTDRIDERVQNYLNTPHLFHQINGISIQNNKFDLNNFEALKSVFWSQIQFNEAVDYIFLGNEAGDFLGVEKSADGKTTLKIRDATTNAKRAIYNLDDRGNRGKLLETKAFDPRTRPWYEAAKKQGKPTWSPIYTSAQLGVLQIAAVMPINQPNDRFWGVLGINLTLSQLSHFLNELEIGSTGEAFLLERSGELVASSTSETYVLKTEKSEKRLQAIESQNTIISATTKKMLAKLGNLQTLQSTQKFSYYRNGDRQIVQVTPLLDNRGLDWLIVVVIPESDFMAQINANTRNTILLCFVALCGAIGVGILTARWVVYPIEQLNEAAKAIASGDLHRYVHLDRTDEVGELARSFNSMAVQLELSFASLASKNEELQRLDRLKDEFLANTSHELRTPLNATIGIVESMLDGATGSLSEVQKKNLFMVAQSGHRLSNLINDILDFSKLRNHTIELQFQPIGLREIVEVVLAFCQSLIGRKPLELVNAVSPNLPAVQADENRLQQILYNLVGNAMKFTDRGMVGVSAEFVRGRSFSLSDPYHLGYIAITISDTGIGIPEERFDRIFASFEQGDGSTAREYGGTGLGLAVTQQLVELHGGTISLKSSVGVGSQFTFTLPIDSDDRNTNHPETAVTSVRSERLTSRETSLNFSEPIQSLDRPTEPDRDGFKVMIVDDEPVNLQVLINHLSNENYVITQAANGMEALSLIDSGYRPDLILLDVMMPKLTGYQVCQTIRETFSSNQLPIVLLTAKNQTADLVTGLNCGANDYLSKPINKQELLARLKTHLKLTSVYTAYDRFVPHKFLQFLNKESILDVKLGDEVHKTMSILFSDIRDFTSLSEQMTPEDNFKFINSYLSQMEPAILENNGFIDKYIGDAIMALFGESADDAVQAGISMLHRLNDYNQHRKRSGYQPIRIGIGINTGELMLGMVGGQRRMDGTVISDAVNAASRIEGLTKMYGVSLLISDRTFSALQNSNLYSIRLIDRVKVKGKSEAISIFEIFDADPPELKAGKQLTKTQLEQGITYYTLGQFAEAASFFAECLQHNPGDTVAQLYERKCRDS
jgi:signal transduction histidine kinase/class 3 adenylate cyclase/CheY-like chemotaxis protein